MHFRLWHSLLDMRKHDADWHRQDIADELRELKEARDFWSRWSETSDVVYTVTRARWSGHKSFAWPLEGWKFWWGAAYMFPKYTSRWLFFYMLGKKLGAKQKVTAVRNPKKVHKLRDVAAQFGIDSKSFEETATRWLTWWPLLK